MNNNQCIIIIVMIITIHNHYYFQIIIGYSCVILIQLLLYKMLLYLIGEGKSALCNMNLNIQTNVYQFGLNI